jgi:diguanylate cyclase (GGDEF)-like protein/PAS domain S-box-containing protein
MPDLGERITRELTIRYIAVLAVLAMLALLSFIESSRIISDTRGAAELVNISGRQRMLIERTAFAATRLAVSGEADRAAAASLLTETLDAVEAGHAVLTSPQRSQPASVKELYYGGSGSIDSALHDFVASGRRLLRPAAVPSPDDPDLQAITAAALGPLLAALDEATVRYQQDADQRMSEVMVLLGAGLLVGLVVLLASALGVFHPMVERIRADILDRCKAERDLRESEERLWRMLEESPVGVSVSRLGDGRIVFANSRFTDILGMSREEFIGSYARDHYVDDQQRRQVLAVLLDKGHIDDAEVEFRRKDGSRFWSLLTIRTTQLEGEPVNLAWIYDITERKAAEQKILLAARVLETITEGVVITNARNEIVFVNPAFTAITEYDGAEVLGQNPRFLSSGRHAGDFYHDMWAGLRATGHWSGEIWNRRKSGEFFAEWLSITVIRDSAGQIAHHVAVFSDITHRKEDEERVWRQANFDALTGLPNRSLFIDRLTQAVRQSRREEKRFALMFIDLDGFKQVNDTLGHAAGDILLQQTAARLSECVRASDTVARLAGDEFTIIMQGIRGHEDAAAIAAKILDALGQSFNLEGERAEVHGSIGVAIFPDHANDGAKLIKLADEAMYSVKRKGKNNYLFVGCDSVMETPPGT